MTPEDQVKQQTIQTVGPAGDVIRDQDKIMLVLSYLGILALIPLLTVKDSPYVQWHAKNGLIIGAAMFLAQFLHAIPFLGTVLGCVAFVALLTLDLMAMVKSLNGVRYRVPFLSDFADKL